MGLLLNILLFACLVIPAVLFILFQWNEKKLHFNWAGFLFIIWNISSLIGSYLMLNGIHNIIFYRSMNLLFQLHILLFLGFLNARTKIWAAVILLIVWSVAFFAYSDSPVLYKEYTMAMAYSSVFFIAFLFYALFKLFDIHKESDMRKVENFWFLIGLIIYFTWINYSCILGYITSIDNNIKMAFINFGTAVASLFFCKGLLEWAKNHRLKGVFNLQNEN